MATCSIIYQKRNDKERRKIMKLINEVKLDFDNVLIVPQPNNIVSRSDVNLKRTFNFKANTWSGVPLITSNMTTVSSFKMAESLSKHGIMTALHKYYSSEQLFDFYNTGVAYEYCWYTIGTNPEDLEKFRLVNHHKRGIDKICIDVANGYRDCFVDYVSRFHDEFPCITIMAGNVVTPDMIEPLVKAGVEILKIGIGGGCFIPTSPIKTLEGFKLIKDVKINDKVLTHKQRWQKVTKIFAYQKNETLIKVNGITSTKNHEYYVLHKKFKEVVTDDNIHSLAEWISAEKLTKDYFLLKHKI
jgi:IMP dehydrogenase/GMP reductase